MGYFSILLGFFLVIFLIVKRWPAILVGLIAATAVIFLNGLPFGETMSGMYYAGFTSMVTSLFPCLFAGSLIAQIYSRTGAVKSIGDAMANALFKENGSPVVKYVSCILAIVLPCGVLAYCGMNSLVTIIALYPIAMCLLERAGIPKRFVMGMLAGGVYSFALAGPGTAQLVNVLGMQGMGTASYAGLVGGLLGVVTEIIVMTVLLTVMIKKAVAKGETFAYGPKDLIVSEDAELPNPFIAIIPLIALVVIFNVFALDIFTATMIAWLLSIVLLWKYIPKNEGSKISELLDIGVKAGGQAFSPVSMVGSLVGFSTIVQSLPEYQGILDAVFAMNITPLLVLIFAISIVAALTGSSTAAIRIGMPVASEQCLAAGFSAAMVHRVSAFACTIVDTLPYSSSMIINLGIADLDMKDGYPPMFISTVVATACGTLVCALFMYVFPYLP